MDTATITADRSGWKTSQNFELDFWKNSWPFRTLPLPKLQEHRHTDAIWFMSQFGFVQESKREFSGFKGTVIEVGCGPIGVFELCEGVAVTGQDTLMDAYAREIPFSTLGKRGATTYTGVDVGSIRARFDFVACGNVLDHTADWLEFTEQLAGLVRPGGELLLFTDSRGSPILGHTQIFSGEQVQRALRLLGAKDFPVSRFDIETTAHCDYRNFIRAKF